MSELSMCKCGAAAMVRYGSDLRFPENYGRPGNMAWTAMCSGDCENPTFSRFTRAQAIESWNLFHGESAPLNSKGG